MDNTFIYVVSLLVIAAVSIAVTRSLMRLRYTVKLDKIKKLHARKIRELEKEISENKSKIAGLKKSLSATSASRLQMIRERDDALAKLNPKKEI